MKTKNSLEELFVAKIKSSKLTEAQAKQLGFELVTKEQVGKLALPAFGGFKIPYFDAKGKPTGFYRIRYLEETKSGFKALTKEKALRYVQPKGTLNEVYLPPLVDWAEILKDPKKPLVITEGELKAACGCAHGFYVMGLGGVWNFRSAQHNLPLLPLLEEIPWEDRHVAIVYDSDSVTNPKVMCAENHLAKELLRRGAEVCIGRIPKAEGGAKQGIDDLILNSGKLAFREVLTNALPFGPAEALFQLNTEVVYVRDPGLILRLDNLQRMAPRAFTDHAYATRIYTERQTTETKGGGTSVKLVEKSAPKEWLKWPNRVEVEKVTYAPGQDRVFDNKLNVWHGWGCEPEAGDVTPWNTLMAYVFRSDAAARKWFEQWLAYPLQNPGTKLFSCVVMWGIIQGTGKSLIGYTVGAIYGKNFTEIKNHNLMETYNEWAENKQFVMGDEITSGDKRGVADKLKSMVTQKEVRLNPKYVPSYTVPDCINYYHTSNHPDAFFLEDNDRRYFIWEVKGAPLPEDFYCKYDAWLKNGGPSHLFDYLLKVDLTDFNPAGHAPMTNSKKEMIDSGKSDVASWVATLKEDPDVVLRLDGVDIKCELFRSEDLLKAYDPEMKTKVTANGLARELRRAGFERVNAGTCCRTSIGHVRLWAVRNAAKYNKMSGDDVGKAYDQERGLNGHKKSKRKF